MQRDGESLTLYGHTLGRSAVCPCCGKRTTTVHRYSLRKIQCTEWLGHHTTLILESRHMVCANPECERSIFAEPLAMCVIVDHYTREVLAVFDSRYGQEILDWLRSQKVHKTLGMDMSKVLSTDQKHALKVAREEQVIQICIRYCKMLHDENYAGMKWDWNYHLN